jgi:hypothetical protein
VIFDAVSPVQLADGSLEKVPGSETEWAAVRTSALLMSEAGNLLMIEGRPIDRLPAFVLSDPARSPRGVTESMPQIARRVSKSRRKWNRLAAGLFDAGAVTLRAVDARDPKALLAAGDVIDAACEACHHEYWYRR